MQLSRYSHWLLFYSFIVISWFLLFMLGANSSSIEVSANIVEAEFWAAICRPNADILDFPRFFLMWSLMSIGMMLPTIIPILNTYDDLMKVKIGTKRGFYNLLIGFFSIWMVFSGLVSLLQMFLMRLNLVSLEGILYSPTISGALLLLAAAYQFSSVKEACLSKCRSPMTFFLEYGSKEKEYEFSLGFRIGLFCLGCCWALMLLAFIGGTMNLFFMAVAMLLMTLEKLPDIGRFLTKPIAFFLMACSIIYFVSPLGIYV